MRKITSVFNIMVALLLCLTTIVSVSALSVAVNLIGDSDLNGSVNVKDATLIQKHVADIVVIDDYALYFADADRNSTVNVKDATTIQKYVAGMTVNPEVGTEATHPDNSESEGTKMDTKITIYFSNNQKWTKVNAYLYNEAAGTQNAEWPGEAMELHSTNDFGEKIYMMNVDVAEFNRVVFNNGTSQSMNASLSVASSGFYIAKNTPKTSMALGLVGSLLI